MSAEAIAASTLPDILRSARDRFGGDVAVIDGDRSLSYVELVDESERFARGLAGSGIANGDRVALWAPNSIDWVVAVFGIWCAGGVLVPLNTRYRGSEAAHAIEASGARLLITVSSILGDDPLAMLDAAGRLSCLEEVVDIDGVRDGTTSIPALLPRATDAALPAALPEDVRGILFTSGTTGRPKGAMLAHGATVRAYADWADAVGLRRGDRYLVVYPFSHSAGLNSGIIASVITGATIVPLATFDVPAIMSAVEALRITMLPGTPAVFQTILDHPAVANHDLSSLRLSVTGAAVVPIELIKRMSAELPFESIITGYGLTESTGIATMCRHDDDAETIATRCGTPIPGVEVRVVDGDGLELPAGEPGEVVIRGYSVMLGYFGDPDATADAIDQDGWLRSGDVGILDERGYLRITDRIKDMLIVGGFNVYPAEVEQVALEHPSISQIAVVGVPDDRLGEVGKAFVVLRPGAEFDPSTFTTWCRERMANFKVPRHVDVVEALPTNATGKVVKYELRDSS